MAEFAHRLVYRDGKDYEALRCLDCGAEPTIEWVKDEFSSHTSNGYIVMTASQVTCPNGPHVVSNGTYEQYLRERLQRRADHAAQLVKAEAPRKKRWYRRG